MDFENLFDGRKEVPIPADDLTLINKHVRQCVIYELINQYYEECYFPFKEPSKENKEWRINKMHAKIGVKIFPLLNQEGIIFSKKETFIFEKSTEIFTLPQWILRISIFIYKRKGNHI